MSPILWILIVATDVIGLALGVWVFWGAPRARERSAAKDVLGFVALGALLGAGFGSATFLALGNGFAILRIWCHVLFCVLAPLLLARGIWRVRNRRAVAFGALLCFVGIMAEATYLYARHVEPYRLQIRHHVVESPRLAGLEKPIRVVVMADLQTDAIGEFERRIFREIDALEPDLLLVPGDLIQLRRGSPEFEAQMENVAELFRGMKHEPRYGTFMVDGDVDLRGRGVPGTRVRLLTDEIVRLPAASRLQIAGLSLSLSRVPVDLEQLRNAKPFDGLTIVMGHAPDFAVDLIRGKARSDMLCIAGHTHGGQIVVPFFGPPLTLSRVPRRFAGGFHRIGDAWLLVSRGIGHERGYAPRVRLFCPPELIVLELRP